MAVVSPVAIAAQLAVIMLSWRRRHLTPSAKWQIGLMFGGIWFAGGILVSSLAGDAGWHTAASALKVVSLPVMAISYHFMVQSLLQPSHRPSRLLVALMCAPVAAYLVAFLIPATRWVTLGELRVAGTEVLWEPPLTFWLLLGFSCLLVVWAGASQAQAINLTVLRHRPQLRSLLIGAMMPLSGAVITISVMIRHDGTWPGSQVEWTTLGLIGTALVHGHALLRQQFLEGVPIDRGVVLAGLHEGVIVFDGGGRLSDFNEAASRLFGDQLRTGVKRQRVISWLGKPQRLGDTEYIRLADREISVRQAPTTPGQEPVGDILILTDVTESNDYKRRLLAANEQLRQHVSTIESLHRELARQADRDTLTGLANRRPLQALLHELAAAPRPFAAILIDVDHFKRINDTHGHMIGDEVLVGAARDLRQFAEDGEALVRFGGEEFLLLIPGGNTAGGLCRAEAVRRWFEQSPILTTAGPVRMTVSAGVACSLSAPGSPEEVLRLADEALYRAKSKGRNRVEPVLPVTH